VSRTEIDPANLNEESALNQYILSLFVFLAIQNNMVVRGEAFFEDGSAQEHAYPFEINNSVHELVLKKPFCIRKNRADQYRIEVLDPKSILFKAGEVANTLVFSVLKTLLYNENNANPISEKVRRASHPRLIKIAIMKRANEFPLFINQVMVPWQEEYRLTQKAYDGVEKCYMKPLVVGINVYRRWMQFFPMRDVGRDLVKVLRDDFIGRKKLSVANRLTISLSLIQACMVLQEKKIIHRDLKLENVVIDDDFRARIIDYGCAMDDKTPYPLANRVVGTTGYMAIESIRRQYTHQSDVCSLCRLLCFILGDDNGRGFRRMADTCSIVCESTVNFGTISKVNSELGDENLALLIKTLRLGMSANHQHRPTLETLKEQFEKFMSVISKQPGTLDPGENERQAGDAMALPARNAT